MVVKEIFNFQDGKIVFVGEINDGSNFIKSCECEIYLNNKYFSKVKLEDEMITKRNQSNLRSLSSIDKLDVPKILSHEGEVWLVCNQ